MSRPIHTILVPGWLDNVRTLGKLRSFLEVAGHKCLICSPQPSDGSVPIPQLSQQLADFIDGGFAPDEPVNLFGFSMGGLIHRYYVQKMDGHRRVRKLVTAASPHRGTMTAKLATMAAALQMRPDSEFIMELNRDLSPLQQVEFTSIWSPFDLTIVPANSSILPVGKAKRVWSPAHGVMMYDPNVMRVIAQTLGE
jgi:triacylglycerol lipase